MNIVAQKDLKLLEVNKILTGVASRIHKEARIIFGVGHEGAQADSVRVTVLATGCVYDGMSDNGDKETSKAQNEPAKEAVTTVTKKNESAKTNKQKIAPPPRVTAKKTVTGKKTKTNNKPKKRDNDKRKVSVKIKNGAVPASVQALHEPASSSTPPADVITAVAPKDAYQNQQSIAAQFESPVRKNALQVKKEIEMEENEMLEKEKVWEIPAFLRKQKK